LCSGSGFGDRTRHEREFFLLSFVFLMDVVRWIPSTKGVWYTGYEKGASKWWDGRTDRTRRPRRAFSDERDEKGCET
jgi:hypothetical protein